MGVLIDASVIIEAERRRVDVLRYMEGGHDEEFFLSVVTVSELLRGVHRATDASVRSRRSAFVESLVTRCPILEVDLEIARSHALIRPTLAAGGELICPHDLWLAASCLARGLRMVTSNLREFTRVPGLEYEDWS